MLDPLEELINKESKSIKYRGWSEGDEEFPLPFIITEDDLELAAKHRQNLPPSLPSKEAKRLKEFPLYYGPFSLTKHRRNNQYHYSSNLLNKGAPLVLMTSDFKVFNAKNIWSLLWLYLLVRLNLVKTSSSL